MKRAILLGVAAVLFLVPSSGFAQVLQMMPVFESRCAQCHGGNAAERRAPDRNALAAMTPERILEALTTGSMVANATGISDGQKRSLAELLSGRPLGSSVSGQASAMKNQCQAKPAFNPGDGTALVGLGQRPDELAHADRRGRGPARRAGPGPAVEVGIWIPERIVSLRPARRRRRPRVRRIRQRLRLLARCGDRLRLLVVRGHRPACARRSALARSRPRPARGTRRTSAISRPTSSRSTPRPAR